MSTKPEPIANLRWLDERWHLAGNPIHAGAHLELRGSTGKWFSVRIESRDNGHKLDAYATIEGLIFHKPIVGTDLRLRWPQYEG